MKKVTHVPWDIAEEAVRIAARANKRYWSNVLSCTAISSILIYENFYYSLAILISGFLFGRSNRLLRRYEAKSWWLMVALACASVAASYFFRKMEFSNILFDVYPLVEIFIPSLFALPAGVVANNIGNKVELCFFKSKGYDYSGYLGNMNYTHEDH